LPVILALILIFSGCSSEKKEEKKITLYQSDLYYHNLVVPIKRVWLLNASKEQYRNKKLAFQQVELQFEYSKENYELLKEIEEKDYLIQEKMTKMLSWVLDEEVDTKEKKSRFENQIRDEINSGLEKGKILKVTILSKKPVLNIYSFGTLLFKLKVRNSSSIVIVRLEIGIGYGKNRDEMIEEIVSRDLQIKDLIFTLMSSKYYDDIDSVDKLNALKIDILNIFNSVLSSGVIEEVYFLDFNQNKMN